MIDPTTALMVTQAAELAALRAEVERLRADAERVEYCVANCLALDFAYGERGDCVLVIQLPGNGRYPANFRNIIDAARATAAPGDVQG